MEALDCIKTRRSVRKYTGEPISREILDQIAQAVTYAPSWKNTQVVRYRILQDPQLLQEIADRGVLDFAFNQKTICRCTALAVQSVVTGVSGFEPDGTPTTSKGAGWEMYDAGISAQTFCLAAHDLGIGTVILGVIDDMAIRDILHLPEGELPTALIAMGHPAFAPEAPRRKAPQEIVHIL